jgi:hypothetical protein
MVGGVARPGSRRGLPPGVTACLDLSGVFANARITKQQHNPTSHHVCKNTPTFTAFGAGHGAPPSRGLWTPTAHIAERYTQFSATNTNINKSII